MMQNAVQIAAQNLEASPEMRGLLEAIAEKYGTDATDLTALTDAIRNGVVKDDAYFEKIAMEKGISVKTAREMDKLETQNKRLTAQQQAAQQMQKAAAGAGPHCTDPSQVGRRGRSAEGEIPGV